MGMTELQAQQLQNNVLKHSGKLPVDTLYEDINKENAKLKNPDAYNDVIQILRARFKNKQAIYISDNVPSSKNSKEIMQMFTGKSKCCNATYEKLAVKMYRCTSCGKSCELGTRTILHNSKNVQEYIDTHSNEYITNRPLFLELIKRMELPIYLGMYFIRQSKHRWDMNNASQIITDLMVKHCLIPDDDTQHLIPVFLGFHHDKDKPGVILMPLSKEYKLSLTNLI
jgi:hypothetical protein